MKNSFSPSCERNKLPILEILKSIINKDNKNLLEIGSGTAQHGLYFAPEFPNIQWYLSDRQENHKTINHNISKNNIANLKAPLSFEVGKDHFPKKPFDLVFTANTLHIMSWKEVKTLIKAFGRHLRPGSQVIIYGPFNYNGNYTSLSNEEFDRHLKTVNPKSGIRSFEDVNKRMESAGFSLTKDFEMPANNRILLYFRTPTLSE